MNKNTVGAAARDLRETLGLPTGVMAYKIGRGCGVYKDFEHGSSDMDDQRLKFMAVEIIKFAEAKSEEIQRSIERLKEVAGL